MGLIPLLSFGIPASNSTAILLGGFLVHGLIPGPILFDRSPDILYGLYTGLMVAVLALPLVAFVTLKLCIWLVNRPKPYLVAFILAIVFSGAYTINNSIADLTLVLCDMVELDYRRPLVISGGDHRAFIEDPISATFLAIAVLFLAGSLIGEYRAWRRRRAAAPAKDQAV